MVWRLQTLLRSPYIFLFFFSFFLSPSIVFCSKNILFAYFSIEFFRLFSSFAYSLNLQRILRCFRSLVPLILVFAVYATSSHSGRERGKKGSEAIRNFYAVFFHYFDFILSKLEPILSMVFLFACVLLVMASVIYFTVQTSPMCKIEYPLFQ